MLLEIVFVAGIVVGLIGGLIAGELRWKETLRTWKRFYREKTKEARYFEEHADQFYWEANDATKQLEDLRKAIEFGEEWKYRNQNEEELSEEN